MSQDSSSPRNRLRCPWPPVSSEVYPFEASRFSSSGVTTYDLSIELVYRLGDLNDLLVGQFRVEGQR